MTSETPKVLNKEEIYEFLLNCGWSQDKQGHLRKQGTKRLFRIKFLDESLRIEVQVERGAPPMKPDSVEWVRIGGAFYRNVKLHTDGRMQVGTDFFSVE